MSLTYTAKGLSPIFSWNWSQFIHFYLLKFWTKFGYDPLWTQDINWTYLKSSGEVQNVFWTPYGPSIYICVQGFPKQQTKACSKSTITTLYGMKKYMTLLEFNITTDVTNFAKKMLHVSFNMNCFFLLDQSSKLMTRTDNPFQPNVSLFRGSRPECSVKKAWDL